MNGTFFCRSVLLCDEVRQEVGGRQIIIGAYSGVILLPYMPFLASRVTLRFEIKAERPHYDHVECTVLRPNGSIFYHENIGLEIRFPEYPTTAIFLLSGLMFEHTGDYTVLLAMDSAPVAVGSFAIITPDMIPQRG